MPGATDSLTVFVDYPEGKVSLPGTGGSIPMGTLFSFPSGTSHSENDLGNQGYALRELVSKAGSITPRPGTLFTLAECETRRGRIATALRRYEQYVSLYPTLAPELKARVLRSAEAQAIVTIDWFRADVESAD